MPTISKGMSEPIIRVENLSKRFILSHEGKERYQSLREVVTTRARQLFSRGNGTRDKQITREEFWALKDINFTINQGDRVGIIGRNGAGKSTLLKIVSRITEPSSGRVTINGRVASLLEVGTGFHPELTGRENIFLNGAILGMSRAEIRTKFDEIVAFAEVEKFLDTPVKRYSSGMYVRLAFAVAAHLEPEILIVDEVLAVGDAQFQKKCLGKMEDVSKNQGRTVLFVSHNMGVITQLCNKGILLHKGEVAHIGAVPDVVGAYLSNDRFAHNGVYLADAERVAAKLNYFTRIATCNAAGQVTTDFRFDEKIVLKFEYTLKEMIPNLQIGIALVDKNQNRVFTILKPVEFFSRENKETFKGSVELPASLIAPNSYAFNFQIWAKGADVSRYDTLENVNRIQIHDNGTDYAVYEGYDYGNVIIDVNWKTK